MAVWLLLGVVVVVLSNGLMIEERTTGLSLLFFYFSGIHHIAGAAGTGSHPPLHAADRLVRARAVAHVSPRARPPRLWQAALGTGHHPGLAGFLAF